MRASLRSLVSGHGSETGRLSAIHAVARVSLALVFLWHGLVPKLLFRHADEIALMRDAGLSNASASRAVVIIGIAEVVFGVALLLAWRLRGLFLLAAGLMLPMTLGTIINSPRFIPAAFTPVTLNLCVAALGIIGWWASNPSGAPLSGRHGTRGEPPSSAR
jgi:uncharacterized membrane protein YphA (DoxX/SURF4 family)